MRRASGPSEDVRVDWEALRDRLGRLVHVGEADTVETRDSAAVLEARARELSRPRQDLQATGGIEVVTFEREGEWYAIDSRHVRAVARVVAPSRLPGAAATVVGVVAWRGHMLALVDLGGRELGSSFMLVLEQAPPSVALLADAVGGVVRIADSELRPLPEALVGRRGVRWVTSSAVLVLDAAELV